MAQCEFEKPDGTRCRAHALKGQKLCRYHAQPEAAREEGRKGGSVGKRQALPEANFSLKSPQEIGAMLEAVTNSMLRGELDRGLASCAGYLAQVLIKAQEAGELEARLAALEATLEVTK